MTLLKVIGVGSPFGDDTVGCRVAAMLKQKESLKKYSPAHLEILELDRPGIHLLDFIKDAKTVFIIDAVKSNQEVGTIKRFEKDEIETVPGLTSTHGFGLGHTLQLGETLKLLPKKLVLYAIEVDNIQITSEISPSVEKAQIKLVALLEKKIIEELII